MLAMDSEIDKILYLLTTCFVLLILSCNSNNSTITQDAQRVIDCNIDDAVRLVNLSDICDSDAKGSFSFASFQLTLGRE